MFKSEKELNNFIKHKNHWINQKCYLKYYIDKHLYDLFSFCHIYHNSFEIEFFTLNPNYKEIWSKMRIFHNYGHTKLIDCGYDELYHCYVVSIQCLDLLEYLKFMHNPYYPFTEKIGKKKQEIVIGVKKKLIKDGEITLDIFIYLKK